MDVASVDVVISERLRDSALTSKLRRSICQETIEVIHTMISRKKYWFDDIDPVTSEVKSVLLNRLNW